MVRNLIGLITALGVLLLLTLTNPGLKTHKFIVKAKVFPMVDEAVMLMADSTSATNLRDRLSGKRGAQFTQILVDDLLRKGITRTNYVLFSTTDLDYKDQKGILGYGILSNVYLSADADRLVRGIVTESVK